MLWLALSMALADEAARDARLEQPPTVRDIAVQESLQDLPWVCQNLTPTLCRLYRGTHDNAVRQAMEQDEDGFGAHLYGARRLVDRPALDEPTLSTDAWRIELWYAHHGWFDARVIGFEVIEVKPRHRLARWMIPWKYGVPSAPVVDVVVQVEEGPRSVVGSVTVNGDEVAGPALERKIERTAEALIGGAYVNSQPYELANYIQNQFQRKGFARATAEVSMVARPQDQEVDITVEVDPGDVCVFGEVEVVGNDAVSTEDILQRVTILPGERYDPEAMNETQRNLFGLGTFSVVQIIPELDGTSQQIPIRIEVTEARFREIKVGGGAAAGGSQGEVRGRFAAEHKNLFGKLLRVDVDATAGQRVLTQPGSGVSPADVRGLVDEQDIQGLQDNVVLGPFATVNADAVWPNLFGYPNLSHTPETRYELRREFYQSYHDVSLAPALTWRPHPRLAISPTYRWEYRYFIDRDLFAPGLDEVEKSVNQWSVQSFGLQTIWNTSRPMFQPTHGWNVRGTVLSAGGFLPGFTWAQGDLDVRKYQAIAVDDFRGVLAFRVAGGYQMPYGDDGHVPSWKRYRLGGSQDVRGYAEGNLGPRLCYERGQQGTVPSGAEPIPCQDIPRNERAVYTLGGRVMAMASMELRMDIPWDAQFVVFHDLGQVWATPQDVSLADLSPTAGFGFRYPTPAGPARLDVGVRYLHPTGREPDYAADRAYGIYIGIGEAF